MPQSPSPQPSPPQSRRERNKQLKRERILAAASALFAERGVEDVTTQEIADAADIGTGTLFLYAKSKSELLLMVQNAHYEEALEAGLAAAAGETAVIDAAMTLIAPIVECNREHVGNGRIYLREMVFGDSTEPHHAQAREFAFRTQHELARIIREHTDEDGERAATLAGVVSAVMLTTMAAAEPELPVAAVVDAVRSQAAAVLPR